VGQLVAGGIAGFSLSLTLRLPRPVTSPMRKSTGCCYGFIALGALVKVAVAEKDLAACA
jgi:hypothetical protein